MNTSTSIRGRLIYDPCSGIFTWISGRRRGLRAGSPLQHGYRVIYWEGRLTYEHRLAWAYVHGEFPVESIDHINGNPSDNRIANLRECSQSQNRQNARPKSGKLKGTFFDASKGKWRAAIGPRGAVKYLGIFDSQISAHLAYADAAKSMYAEFARTT